MSARALVPKNVDRRVRRLPWGIEVQTWRLVDTRTLPNESSRLPISALFDGDDELGSVPASQNDAADTLETPIGEITRETSVAPDYVEIDTKEDS